MYRFRRHVFTFMTWFTGEIVNKNILAKIVLPDVVIVEVVERDCMEHYHAAAAVEVLDFVEGAREEIELLVGPY